MANSHMDWWLIAIDISIIYYNCDIRFFTFALQFSIQALSQYWVTKWRKYLVMFIPTYVGVNTGGQSSVLNIMQALITWSCQISLRPRIVFTTSVWQIVQLRRKLVKYSMWQYTSRLLVKVSCLSLLYLYPWAQNKIFIYFTLIMFTPVVFLLNVSEKTVTNLLTNWRENIRLFTTDLSSSVCLDYWQNYY